MQTTDILRELVAFPTLSRTSNIALLDYVRSLMHPTGAQIDVISDERDRANLWITVGPPDRPGVVLSGHSDVVPVAGQDWRRDPFALTEEDGTLFGRGTADMKGFLACALRCATLAANRELSTPLHIAISYDEEVGCLGVRSLIDRLRALTVQPALCIIGEPTSMRIATGHKGKMALRAICRGREAHSALAPTGLNAIYLASKFIRALEDLQIEFSEFGQRDRDYAVPYTTIHVGVIHGGEALNIVPAHCTLDFEIRNIAIDNLNEIKRRIVNAAEAIASPLRPQYPEAAIQIEETNSYPGLDTRHEGAIRFVTGLLQTNEPPTKVSFGTEGGLFSQKLGIPTIVCGPGSMQQGHKPDEFVTREQLDRCDAMLSRLLTHLETGVSI